MILGRLRFFWNVYKRNATNWSLHNISHIQCIRQKTRVLRISDRLSAIRHTHFKMIKITMITNFTNYHLQCSIKTRIMSMLRYIQLLISIGVVKFIFFLRTQHILKFNQKWLCQILVFIFNITNFPYTRETRKFWTVGTITVPVCAQNVSGWTKTK